MNSELTELLSDSIVDLPIAFATWKTQGAEIFVSDRLKQIIKVNTNILNPYDFVKSMQKIFGSFLNISVEKVSQPDFFGNYSSTVNILGQEYTLKLSFNRTKQVYIFLIDHKIEKNLDNNLAEILDNLPIYIWQKNKDLKLTYCNKPYADALESTKESAIKNNLRLIPQSKNSVYIDHSLYLTKPKKLTEHIIINGSRRLISIEETPFLGKEKSTGIAIDITEREELEKSYKNYKKQTEDTLNNISVPVAVFDENSILIFANEALINLFSIEKLDISENCKFADIIDYILSNNSLLMTEDIAKYKEITKDLFQTIIEPYHTNLQLANGKIFNVNITPNQAGGLIFVFEDVSDRITLERKLNSISSIQGEILNYLSEGVVVFGSDNKIKIANQFLAKLLQLPENQDFKELHISDYFKSAKNIFGSKEEFEFWISKLINKIAKRSEFSETLNLQSGQFIKYEYIPLPEGFNLIRFSEITDSINLEKVQNEKTELLNQIDETKSSLISNISREIKSPLQTASGFAEVLYNKYFGELNEKQLGYCRGIIESIETLINISDSVINLANLESGILKLKYEETDLSKFINELADTFSKQIHTQNIKIKSEFNTQDFMVFIDRKIMQQVCYQIINKIRQNASKQIIVSIAVNVPENMPDYFNFMMKTQNVVLDNSDVQKINDVLINDLKSNVLNTSLDFGLIFANKAIRSHNGKMFLKSDDKETIITCCLPIKQFLQ